MESELKRRTFCMMATLGAFTWPGIAASQTYPSRPIQLIVGFPPGSATDFIARLIAPKMAEGLGQPVVVENRPGASGVVAATAVSNAAPDGYTIMVTVPGSITTAKVMLKEKLQYSPQTDLVPIGLIGRSPLLLVVKADSGMKSVAELTALAKATSGGMSVGSYGVGSPSHFAVETLRVQSKLPIVHVPFNGSGALQTALLGGVIPAAVDSLTAVLPFLDGRRIVALAVTSPQRIDVLPNVPTTTESGLGPIELGGWAGLHGPKGTSANVVRVINAEMNRVLALPEIRNQLKSRLLIVGGAPSVFETYIKTETELVTRIVQEARLTFE